MYICSSSHCIFISWNTARWSRCSCRRVAAPANIISSCSLRALAYSFSSMFYKISLCTRIRASLLPHAMEGEKTALFLSPRVQLRPHLQKFCSYNLWVRKKKESINLGIYHWYTTSGIYSIHENIHEKYKFFSRVTKDNRIIRISHQQRPEYKLAFYSTKYSSCTYA